MSTNTLSIVTPETADTPAEEPVLTQADLKNVRSPKTLINAMRGKHFDVDKFKGTLAYEAELEKLQIELVKMQRWVQEKKKRVAILFEGRDAAGKGGTILRFTEHLNPRALRVVALPKPTKEESGQWYFQRYMKQLPNRGELVLFDRSWYNRAVVEPVNGFCTSQQYELFMQQVPEFEHMLLEDGITLIKFWFSISKKEQLKRFEDRRESPLRQWKISPIDDRAQELWDDYTKYKERMFSHTHTASSPWLVVRANNKKKARLETIRYVLSVLDYSGKDKAEISLNPNPNVVQRYHRALNKLD
jgi:polyphosphate kinase